MHDSKYIPIEMRRHIKLCILGAENFKFYGMLTKPCHCDNVCCVNLMYRCSDQGGQFTCEEVGAKPLMKNMLDSNVSSTPSQLS